MNHNLVERGMELILKGLNINPTDQNFLDTPERYARALEEMFCPRDTEWATFTEEYTDFILLRGHQMWSLCPHHMLPVSFTVSLAYIPDGHVLGLSKLARLLHSCNTGPLLQEKFTKQALEELHAICPGVKGSACIVQGIHSCLTMRGVRSDADFLTYRLNGIFNEDRELERRFFQLARK